MDRGGRSHQPSRAGFCAVRGSARRCAALHRRKKTSFPSPGGEGGPRRALSPAVAGRILRRARERTTMCGAAPPQENFFSFSRGRRWTATGALTSRRGPDEGFLAPPRFTGGDAAPNRRRGAAQERMKRVPDLFPPPLPSGVPEPSKFGEAPTPLPLFPLPAGEGRGARGERVRGVSHAADAVRSAGSTPRKALPVMATRLCRGILALGCNAGFQPAPESPVWWRDDQIGAALNIETSTT